MNKNLGGRISLNVGEEVRYLDALGCVSEDVYVIDAPNTDYRARASLRNGDSVIPTHYDRILPVETGGKAIAVLGDKEITITCPECHKVVPAEAGQTHITCCSTLEVFFMSDATQEIKVQEEQKFDIAALKSDYEVWVREGNKFGDKTALTTVQLVLLEGEEPRKMSFNLYDGKLNTSGKQGSIRLEEFKSGVVEEGKKKFWYPVKTATYQKKLEKDGYVKL